MVTAINTRAESPSPPFNVPAQLIFHSTCDLRVLGGWPAWIEKCVCVGIFADLRASPSSGGLETEAIERWWWLRGIMVEYYQDPAYMVIAGQDCKDLPSPS